MTPEGLKSRLTDFGIEVVKFCRALRRDPGCWNIADQLSASGTAIGANYRVACRARSRKEFLSKLCIALEEADESVGWLEVIAGAALGDQREGVRLLAESREIVAI